MPRLGLLLLLGTALSSPYAALAQDADDEKAVLLDDFEAEPEGYRYVGGEEFPGAQGGLERDTTVAHSGTASEKLSADFSGGGAYVGLWKTMPDLDGKRLVGLSLWVRSLGVESIGIRLGDASGQCHQKKTIPVPADGEWHELVLRLDDIIGEESWGGANDQQWHGPATGLGINIGRDSVAGGDSGALWIDDLRAIVTSEPLGIPTALACELLPPSCRPGLGSEMTLRWDAEPMGRDFTVFVHIRDAEGRMMMQLDHAPPTGTAVWSGRQEYARTIVVPVDMPEGEYRIALGFYDHAASERGWDHQPMRAGDGVELSDDGMTAVVGTLIVDTEAPVPELGPATLDLTGFRLTFDESFLGPLDVSAWGPGTRWIAHTPYAGDFGDARFSDPEDGFPFTIEDGILCIEARRDEGGWRAGLLSSVDPKGEGFSQQYGYFEMRARFPKGLGVWPAFWLLGVPKLQDPSVTQIEIDVVEYYGVGPNALHTTVHLWHPNGDHWADGHAHIVQGMTDDLHDYGVMVTEDEITFYFDGVELRRVPTPEAARVPLYLLVNLALGGGWPTDETPSPSRMYVDHVRAYALPSQ